MSIEKKRYFQKKTKDKQGNDGRVLRLFIFLATILLLVLIWLQKDVVYAYSQYGYLGIFIINFLSSSTVVVPLPGVAIVFLGGAVLSPILVGITSGMGATLGELFGYFLGYGGRGLVRSWENRNHRLIKVERFFHKTGFITTFIFSLLPLPFFDFIGILAGTLSYSLWKFALATFLGRVIRNFLIAWTGAKVLPF